MTSRLSHVLPNRIASELVLFTSESESDSFCKHSTGSAHDESSDSSSDSAEGFVHSESGIEETRKMKNKYSSSVLNQPKPTRNNILKNVENKATQNLAINLENLENSEVSNSRVSEIESVKTTIREPEGINNRSASLNISWDPKKLHLSGAELIQELITSKPRITVGGGRNIETGMASISINASQMQPGEDKIVGDKIFELLSKKRSPKAETAMKSPSSKIGGRWDLEIDYFSSKSDHILYLEQDGNWLKGIHKTDFSIREVSGSIEGNEVKFLSPGRRPAVSYTFSGTISGNSISGKIDMGEFLTADFTGKKNTKDPDKIPIVFPEGRPMGN
jgi:hypothetical protein